MSQRATPVLVIALVVATCGLIYELLAGTVASWILGDSVTQFSTVIGLYLAALGLGSYLSGRMERDLALRFVQTEIALAAVGGLSIPALFLLFASPGWFRALLYAAVVACGTLVGLEIPLLVRVLGERSEFKTVVARVLAYDYAGSLLGSLLFSLVLVPDLGPLRTALLVALLNTAVAFATTFVLRDGLRSTAGLRAAAAITAVALMAVMAGADGILARAEPDVPIAGAPS